MASINGDPSAVIHPPKVIPFATDTATPSSTTAPLQDVVVVAPQQGAAAPIAPERATPLVSMKSSIKSFVETTSRLALYKVLTILLQTEGPQVKFHSLVYKKDAAGNQILISTADFFKDLKAWLRLELAGSAKNKFLAELLILTLPRIKYILDLVLGNIFAQVEQRAQDEIRGLVKSETKATNLLNFVSEKIQRMIELETLVSRGEKFGYTTDIDYFNLLKDSTENNAPIVHDHSIDGTHHLSIVGSTAPLTQEATFETELDKIYLDLSKVLIDCFYPKFDFGLKKLENDLQAFIKNLKVDLDHDSIDDIHYALIASFVNLLTFILDGLVKPTNSFIDNTIHNLSHTIGDSLLKTIIEGAVNGVCDTIQRNDGFQGAVQSEIYKLLINPTTQPITSPTETPKERSIHKTEKEALVNIHTTVMTFLRSVSTAETFLGSIAEGTLHGLAQAGEGRILPYVLTAYAQHFNEETLFSAANAAFKGATTALETIDLPLTQSRQSDPDAAKHLRKSQRFHRRQNRIFRNRLPQNLPRLVGLAPVAPVAVQEPAAPKGALGWLYSTGACIAGSIGSLAYSAANAAVSFNGSGADIPTALSETIIIPKLAKVKKTFLNPKVLTALVQGSLPAVDSYLRRTV
jgi:hypothetical protein